LPALSSLPLLTSHHGDSGRSTKIRAIAPTMAHFPGKSSVSYMSRQAI
jgi:hypothetical protein